MQLQDIGYVAGIVDGEGSLSINRGKPCIHVGMSDEDIVRRLHVMTGIGNVWGPYASSKGMKPMWRWGVTRSRDVAALLMTMWPLLGERRKAKAEDLLAAWHKMPGSFRAKPQPIRHGTYGGYGTHRHRGETACAECKQAAAKYAREWRRHRAEDS